VIVFALDAAAVRTGWAVLSFEEGSPTLVDYGAMELPKTMKIGERLALFRSTLLDLINEYEPDRVSVEEPYIRFFKTSMVLVKVAGIVDHLAYETTGKEALVIHPSTVRSQLGVKTKGDVAKADVAKKVVARFGIQETEFDETDAIAVGWVTPAIIRRKECQKPKRKRKKKAPKD